MSSTKITLAISKLEDAEDLVKKEAPHKTVPVDVYAMLSRGLKYTATSDNKGRRHYGMEKRLSHNFWTINRFQVSKSGNIWRVQKINKVYPMASMAFTATIYMNTITIRREYTSDVPVELRAKYSVYREGGKPVRFHFERSERVQCVAGHNDSEAFAAFDIGLFLLKLESKLRWKDIEDKQRESDKHETGNTEAEELEYWRTHVQAFDDMLDLADVGLWS